MQKRNRRARFFALFDGADPNASTPVRDVTTVPTQALFFLNDPFLHEQAAQLADRLLAGAADGSARVDLAFRELFGRSPSAAERGEALEFLAAYAAAPPAGEENRSRAAWSAYVRVLLASNEFLHVD